MGPRRFRVADLIWLEPIARKYGDWELILRCLDVVYGAWVVEGKCLFMVYRDDCKGLGPCVGGLTDRAGVKHVIQLGKIIGELCPLAHGHWDRDSWEARLFLKHGCKYDAKTDTYIHKLGL